MVMFDQKCQASNLGEGIANGITRAKAIGDHFASPHEDLQVAKTLAGR
jgi:hypothetical protein